MVTFLAKISSDNFSRLLNVSFTEMFFLLVSLIIKLNKFNYSIISIHVPVFCLFVCFGALRPKSTAKVMAGRSVHLFTLFPGQA